MRIRNSYLPLPPPSLSSLSSKRLHYSDDQIAFDRSPESQHVMISRINGRINRIVSTSRTFNKQEQDQGIGHEEEEEQQQQKEEEMKFAPANQSLIGGWREEEKAMPFKKRRMISSEEKEESGSMDRGKMVKGEENLMRCGRTDGRRWRCSRRSVEGYPMCEHHLLTRSSRYRSENLKREIAEEGDQEKKKKKKKKKTKKKKKVVMEGKCENEDGKNNNNNKRKVVKARSINSLLRESVPLMPLNL